MTNLSKTWTDALVKCVCVCVIVDIISIPFVNGQKGNLWGVLKSFVPTVPGPFTVSRSCDESSTYVEGSCLERKMCVLSLLSRNSTLYFKFPKNMNRPLLFEGIGADFSFDGMIFQ